MAEPIDENICNFIDIPGLELLMSSISNLDEKQAVLTGNLTVIIKEGIENLWMIEDEEEKNTMIFSIQSAIDDVKRELLLVYLLKLYRDELIEFVKPFSTKCDTDFTGHIEEIFKMLEESKKGGSALQRGGQTETLKRLFLLLFFIISIVTALKTPTQKSSRLAVKNTSDKLVGPNGVFDNSDPAYNETLRQQVVEIIDGDSTEEFALATGIVEPGTVGSNASALITGAAAALAALALADKSKNGDPDNEVESASMELADKIAPRTKEDKSRSLVLGKLPVELAVIQQSFPVLPLKVDIISYEIATRLMGKSSLNDAEVNGTEEALSLPSVSGNTPNSDISGLKDRVPELLEIVKELVKGNETPEFNSLVITDQQILKGLVLSGSNEFDVQVAGDIKKLNSEFKNFDTEFSGLFSDISIIVIDGILESLLKDLSGDSEKVVSLKQEIIDDVYSMVQNLLSKKDRVKFDASKGLPVPSQKKTLTSEKSETQTEQEVTTSNEAVDEISDNVDENVGVAQWFGNGIYQLSRMVVKGAVGEEYTKAIVENGKAQIVALIKLGYSEERAKSMVASIVKEARNANDEAGRQLIKEKKLKQEQEKLELEAYEKKLKDEEERLAQDEDAKREAEEENKLIVEKVKKIMKAVRELKSYVLSNNSSVFVSVDKGQLNVAMNGRSILEKLMTLKLFETVLLKTEEIYKIRSAESGGTIEAWWNGADQKDKLEYNRLLMYLQKVRGLGYLMEKIAFTNQNLSVGIANDVDILDKLVELASHVKTTLNQVKNNTHPQDAVIAVYNDTADKEFNAKLEADATKAREDFHKKITGAIKAVTSTVAIAGLSLLSGTLEGLVTGANEITVILGQINASTGILIVGGLTISAYIIGVVVEAGAELPIIGKGISFGPVSIPGLGTAGKALVPVLKTPMNICIMSFNAGLQSLYILPLAPLIIKVMEMVSSKQEIKDVNDLVGAIFYNIGNLLFKDANPCGDPYGIGDSGVKICSMEEYPGRYKFILFLSTGYVIFITGKKVVGFFATKGSKQQIQTSASGQPHAIGPGIRSGSAVASAETVVLQPAIGLGPGDGNGAGRRRGLGQRGPSRGGYTKHKVKKLSNKNRKANKTKKPKRTLNKNKKSKHNSSQKKNKNKKTKTKKHRNTIRRK